MKLIAFFLLAVTLHVSASSFSQTVTISGKNLRLDKVFTLIHEQTGYEFIYDEKVIEKVPAISLHEKDAPLTEVLAKCLQDLPFKYVILDKTIVISYKTTVSQSADTSRLPATPPKTIKIRVADSVGKPLEGASVLNKKTKHSGLTDSKGIASVDVSKGDVVEISFVGFVSYSFTVKEDYIPTMVIKLKAVNKNLEELVITGYGNFNRGNFTGAATTVKASDILKAGVSTIDQMLEGVIPGMYVTTPSGQVGTAAKIRVRGTSTLLGSQEPVWVVDGVIQTNPNPYENTSFSTMNQSDIRELAGSAISWLSPNDIETITVLKDASSTAIYGSKAANGVIVITTKKATMGALSVNYSGNTSISQIPGYGLYDRMNSQELMQYAKENYDDRTTYQYGVLPLGYAGLVYRRINNLITLDEMNAEYKQMSLQNTDYFKALFKSGISNMHSINMSGGSESVQSRNSFSYNKQVGEAKGNDLSSFNGTSNTTIRIQRKLTLNVSLSGDYREVSGFAYGVDPFSYAYNTARIYPLYNNDGSLYYYPKTGSTSHAIAGLNSYNYNIQNEIDNTGAKNKTWTWNTIASLNWNILPALTYQSTFGYSGASARSDQWATELSYYITQLRGYEYGSISPTGTESFSSPLPIGGLYEYQTNTTNSITTRNALVFSKNIRAKNYLLTQVGFETRSSQTDGFNQSRYGYLKYRGNTFAAPPFTYNQLGNTSNVVTNDATISTGSTFISGSKNNYVSEYGQLAYSYDNRYTLNGTLRYDASNRFGQFTNRKFQPIWSLGGKWRIGNEEFLKERFLWLDVFDLYGSYGFQGQAIESISPYLTAYYGGVVSGYNVDGFTIDKLPYKDLGWQKTNTWNGGFDLAMFKGRVSLNGNLYWKKSMVYNSVAIPSENGLSSSVVSGTIMRNSGYDLNLGITPILTKNFTWNLSINTALDKNTIVATRYQDNYSDILSGKANVSGDPYSTMYSYQYTGLLANTGQPMFNYIDQNKLDSYGSILSLLVKTGKFTPDIQGGLMTNFRYKKITLAFNFSGQFGGSQRLPELYSPSLTGTPDPMQNISRSLFNRWRKSGDENIPGIYPAVPGTANSNNELDLGSVSNIYNNGGSQYRSRYELYNYSNVRAASTNMIRCTYISGTYFLDGKALGKLPAKRISLGASMSNPFMWVSSKKWNGIDPSTGGWPARRTTSLSVQVSL